MQNIKEGIEGKPVGWYSEVFDTVFKGVDRKRAGKLWKKELAEPKKDKSSSDHHDDD